MARIQAKRRGSRDLRPAVFQRNHQVSDSAFKVTLLRTGVPRLKTHGYAYDERLRRGDELYGFGKPLGEDVQAIVQFQRHCDAANGAFTINLTRTKTSEVEPRVYGGYAGSRGARLSSVLWFVYNLRLYPQPDQWWDGSESGFDDALDQFERFGLTWIEDPQSPKPWEMPVHRGQEFADSVREIVGLELERSGYRPAVKLLAGHVPYLYFVKSAPDGTYAFVEMQPAYSLDSNEFTFDVRLQRKASGDPFDFGGRYQQWRMASLGQLAWRARHVDAMGDVPLEEAKSLLWHYADQHELIDQLRDALDKIKQIGITWLEGSDTIVNRDQADKEGA